MSQFMLVIRAGDTDYAKFSPKDFEELMKKYQNWTQKLINEGVYVGGEKLSQDLGKTLRGKGTGVVVDGPYADSKEAIAGYFIVKAKNLDEALGIGKGCPSLGYGGNVEVRAVEAM